MTDLKVLLERAVDDVAPAVDVEADLARGRAALRRRRVSASAAAMVTVAAVTLLVPRLVPDGGGSAGPAGPGPSASVTERERTASEVYAAVDAALAERGLTPAEPLRWSSDQVAAMFTEGLGTEDQADDRLVLTGRALSGNASLPGGSTLFVVLSRLDEPPALDADYCGYYPTGICRQRDLAGSVLVEHRRSVDESRPAALYREVTLVTADGRAVRVAADDAVGMDGLVDLVTDPRLRW